MLDDKSISLKDSWKEFVRLHANEDHLIFAELVNAKFSEAFKYKVISLLTLSTGIKVDHQDKK